jgi:Family of unknown function (DUF6176)
METTCTKIKIRKNCEKLVYQWAKELNSRKDEVLETLKNESVFWESAFIDKQGEDFYLIYIMKFESRKKLMIANSTTKHSIDKYHKRFKDSAWEHKEKLELLIDFGV